jgi:3'-phosphoadenosine 5'-phosphosulfate sulfotransferase
MTATQIPAVDLYADTPAASAARRALFRSQLYTREPGCDDDIDSEDDADDMITIGAFLYPFTFLDPRVLWPLWAALVIRDHGGARDVYHRGRKVRVFARHCEDGCRFCRGGGDG